jgi:hypothetical protein
MTRKSLRSACQEFLAPKDRKGNKGQPGLPAPLARKAPEG